MDSVADIILTNTSNVTYPPSFPWTPIPIIRFQWLETLSQVCGWVYFFAWTISFYPQVWQNWRRKSVVGLSFDFLLLNIFGHSLYSIFNCFLYFSPYIREDYLEKYGPPIPVIANDVAFSLHAVAITLFTIFQCFIYERGGQNFHWLSFVIVWCGLMAGLIQVILACLSVETWLTLLFYASYVKVGCSFAKYVPQAYFNYQRKSTVGWSIGNIILDLTGGFLSLLQMIMDSINSNSWSGITGNPAKFGLSQLTIIFDLFFVFQHYYLYTEREEYKPIGLPFNNENDDEEHVEPLVHVSDESRRSEPHEKIQ